MNIVVSFCCFIASYLNFSLTSVLNPNVIPCNAESHTPPHSSLLAFQTDPVNFILAHNVQPEQSAIAVVSQIGIYSVVPAPSGEK